MVIKRRLMFPSGFDPCGIKPRKQKPRGESFSKPCDEPGDFFSSFVNLSIFIELTLWKINLDSMEISEKFQIS